MVATGSRSGFTLVECLLAGTIISITALALFDGIGVSARIAHENAQLLAADAVAWDAVWKKFNEDYGKMRTQTEESLTEAAAPTLWLDGAAAVLRVTVQPVTVVSGGIKVEMKSIEADVEWGPAGKRRKLSDWHRAFVYRSNLGRVGWE